MKIKIESSGVAPGRAHHVDDEHALTILSKGEAHTTRVLGPDGAEIRWVQKVEIKPIEAGTLVHAIVHLFMPKVDIEATPILSLENVQESARYYGYRLVPLIEDVSDGAVPQEGA